MIFEEVPGDDPPPTNPNGGTGTSGTTGTTSSSGGVAGPGGLLPNTTTGGLPNAPCSNNCAWYSQSTEQNFEAGGCSSDEIFVDNECVSPSNYPGKEDGYPFKWWEDDLWMDQNLNFNIDNSSDYKLTAAEKSFFRKHPRAQGKILLAKNSAEEETYRRYPGAYPVGYNDKADAFRHTYWMTLIAWLLENSSLAKEFGIAHESEVSTAKHLEKIMDLHNNDVGISIRESLFYPTPQEIIDAVVNAMSSGRCWYLKSIDVNTHEITPDSYIAQTNQ